ncbi:MAG: hypothetical protein DMG96_42040 [Acidobacteria bacterium]|nr:MAG: hypothetical protein DMG96_42040 [Acidobacteriota bacterium]
MALIMTALHVHSLHALAYCERLFYLEEVLRVADERVYAGRRLHVEIEREEEAQQNNADRMDNLFLVPFKMSQDWRCPRKPIRKLRSGTDWDKCSECFCDAVRR